MGHGSKGKGSQQGNENEKILKRAKWLSDKVCPHNPISNDAIAALMGLGISKAMELMTAIQDGEVKNPNGWIIAAAKREGLVPPDKEAEAAPSPRGSKGSTKGSGKGGGKDSSKLHRRVTWLNGNVCQDAPINEDALAALGRLELSAALELLKNVEEKSGEIRNPTGYIVGAVNRLAGGGGGGQHQGPPEGGKGHARGFNPDPDFEKIHRRATWLSANVFVDKPIEDNAIETLVQLGVPRALQLLKEAEEKAGELHNPTAWLGSAARKELQGSGAPARVMGPPVVYFPPVEDADFSKIHRRVTWLNFNVFPDRPPIDEEAINAMVAMGVPAALEMLKSLEEKGAEIGNPSGWLKNAAKRKGFMPLAQVPEQFLPQYGESFQEVEVAVDMEKIHRRAKWLSHNVFPDRHIEQSPLDALANLGTQRAMELFKELEEKAPEINNPNGWLLAAAKRSVSYAAPPQAPLGNDPKDYSKIHRKVTWLNGNVFAEAPLDRECIDALAELELDRAFAILSEVEGKAAEVKNPSGFVKVAVKRATGVMPKRRLESPAGEARPAKVRRTS